MAITLTKILILLIVLRHGFSKRSIVLFDIYTDEQDPKKDLKGIIRVPALNLDMKFENERMNNPLVDSDFYVSFSKPTLINFVVKKRFDFKLINGRKDQFQNTLHLNIQNTKLNLAIKTELNWIYTESDFEFYIKFKSNVKNIAIKYLLSFASKPTCPFYSLSHNLTTVPKEVLYFSSNVSQTCPIADKILGQPGQLETGINITLNSEVWKQLNLNLEQMFYQNGLDGSESMFANTSIVNVNVTGEWSYKNNNQDAISRYFMFKRAEFKSRSPTNLPNFFIEYTNQDGQGANLLVQVPWKDNLDFNYHSCWENLKKLLNYLQIAAGPSTMIKDEF